MKSEKKRFAVVVATMARQSQTVYVEANDEDDAMEVAIKKFRPGHGWSESPDDREVLSCKEEGGK